MELEIRFFSPIIFNLKKDFFYILVRLLINNIITIYSMYFSTNTTSKVLRCRYEKSKRKIHEINKAKQFLYAQPPIPSKHSHLIKRTNYEVKE